jgi:putative component of membrane protein insertase Oxa1/YidC/SpoIIIJ protein YidD
MGVYTVALDLTFYNSCHFLATCSGSSVVIMTNKREGCRPGMLRCVALVRTDVSEELGTMLVVTSNPHTAKKYKVRKEASM